MERPPQPDGGENRRPIEPPTRAVGEPTAPQDTALSWDERVIRDGIQAAADEGRPIDDRTARYIAGQLHGGQASGLYALASIGAITDRVMTELVRDRPAHSPSIQHWIDVLIAYCASRPNHDAVADWVEQAEAQDRADLVECITAGSVGAVGDIAVIYTPEQSDAADDEHDSFSWSDAARWSAEDAAEVGMLTDDELSALIDMAPDEEVGDIDELEWYCLIRRPDGLGGGIIQRRNSDGLSHSWVIPDDEQLTARWAAIVRDTERYAAERQAYEDATAEAGDSASGIRPQIWVGSLADYNAGYLHGEWFDATRETDELQLATQFMLRSSRTPNAEEWAVMDYEGFGPLRLGEYTSFEMISRIAAGIAEHGQAFAAWAAHVGPESHDALDRFGDHYRGEWDSFEAYVEDYLRETDFYRFLDEVPEGMRGYVEVDVEQIARDWGGDYEVVERPEGGVWVFE